MADLHDPEDDGGAAETHGFRSTKADAVLDDLWGFLARYALPSLVTRSRVVVSFVVSMYSTCSRSVTTPHSPNPPL